MKNFKFIIVALFASVAIIACSDDDDTSAPAAGGGTSIDFSGSFAQEDQIGRPAINTVFVGSADKNTFNTTQPSAQSAAFEAKFGARLLALNAAYTTNALGQDSATFAGLLATDVLNVSLDGTTTFFDGTNVLTGRNLSDDVIDTELLLIFGGSAGTDNSGLTSDNVDANDKMFLTTFPYLAAPH